MVHNLPYQTYTFTLVRVILYHTLFCHTMANIILKETTSKDHGAFEIFDKPSSENSDYSVYSRLSLSSLWHCTDCRTQNSCALLGARNYRYQVNSGVKITESPEFCFASEDPNKVTLPAPYKQLLNSKQ